MNIEGLRYTSLKVQDQEYKLRLGIKQIRQYKNEAGKEPLDVLLSMDMDNENEEISNEEITNMMNIDNFLPLIYYSLLRFQPDITKDDVDDIYDLWVDEGNSIQDLINLVMKIMEVSGIFQRGATEQIKEKQKEEMAKFTREKSKASKK